MNRLKQNYWRHYYWRRALGWCVIVLAGLAVSAIVMGVGSMIAGLIIDALY
jgi:hypothetical protein